MRACALQCQVRLAHFFASAPIRYVLSIIFELWTLGLPCTASLLPRTTVPTLKTWSFLPILYPNPRTFLPFSPYPCPPPPANHALSSPLLPILCTLPLSSYALYFSPIHALSSPLIYAFFPSPLSLPSPHTIFMPFPSPLSIPSPYPLIYALLFSLIHALSLSHIYTRYTLAHYPSPHPDQSMTLPSPSI